MTLRKKKIRGHKRRWNNIENWRLDNLSLDLKDYLLNQHDRYYAKIRVHPWSGLSLTNNVTPEPTGKTKLKMLNGLIDIYEDWKSQLEKLGQAYYLKVWLFEPRFTQSQVVCAIGDRIDFYENIFYKSENSQKFNTDNYGQLKSKLENFTWGYRIDEDSYDIMEELGEPEIYASKKDYEETKKYFDKLLKKPHRTSKYKESNGELREIYSFRRGNIWLGA